MSVVTAVKAVFELITRGAWGQFTRVNNDFFAPKLAEML